MYGRDGCPKLYLVNHQLQLILSSSLLKFQGCCRTVDMLTWPGAIFIPVCWMGGRWAGRGRSRPLLQCLAASVATYTSCPPCYIEPLRTLLVDMYICAVESMSSAATDDVYCMYSNNHTAAEIQQ